MLDVESLFRWGFHRWIAHHFIHLPTHLIHLLLNFGLLLPQQDLEEPALPPLTQVYLGKWEQKLGGSTRF